MSKPNISQAVAGMNLDSVISQLKEGQWTYALNAVVENFDGNSVTLQNEPRNEFVFNFPSGYKVIGVRNILQLNKTLFLLTNPTTGDSEVGFGYNDSGVYETIISDVNNDCKFNFSIDHPVHKIIVKSDNCSTQAYFTDAYNHRRYIDFDDLPWKEIPDPNNSFKKIKLVGKLDCNKLNVQPSYSIPKIKGREVTIGGSLICGVYQGIVQYSNALGEGLTAFYNATNPISIFEQKESVDFNLPTSKAITFTISDLDTSGLYEYFNLSIIKTINDITTVDVVGTFPIGDPVYIYTYSGTNKTDRTINIEDIFEKFPYYDIAGDIFEVDNVLGWGILSEQEEPNYQAFWSKVHLMWESHKLTYNEFQGYSNGLNSERYRSGMRDEVYPYEGCFLLTNGKQTRACHIPGRIALPYDLELINTENPDNAFSTLDKCDPAEAKPRWKVYNTANVVHTVENPLDPCYTGLYQFGEFAYVESTDTYPNNPLIWGELANKPIRHHKFPDVLVSPIHDNNINNDPSFEHSVFPIGVRIDAKQFIEALKATLTPAQISQIAGFKILRGNRVNNKSIIAKGLIHNVGSTKVDDRNFYFPNYPFNDLRRDPYFVNGKMLNHVGFQPLESIEGFNDESRSHFTFHSPDTHFYQPSIDNTGEYLKFESIEYGRAQGHFVKVKDNAEYKFLTPRTINAAAGLAIASGVVIGAGQFGWPEYNMASAVPTYSSTIELFEKLSPFTNFAYSFNSVGNYANSFPIPNDGFKQRGILYNKYVIDGLNGVEEGKILNNYRRESAVYIKTTAPTNFANEYSPTIPMDNSRYNLASLGDGLAPEIQRTSNICSYYGSLKRELLNQWGRMYSYETIDTGFYQDLKGVDGEYIDNYPTVFGGDIFINRFAYKSKVPFFRDNTVGAPNQTDIAYDELGNINYPMFWISTKSQRYDIDIDKEIEAVRKEFLSPSFLRIVLNIFTGGAVGSSVAMKLVGKIFSELYSKLGFKNVNMDRGENNKLYEEGLFYLFAYGIPYFFCESEVNVDYRQATNQREGDFYPNVGGDIPDDWVQETSVPIIQDNKYTYNKTYSKQNKENFFAHLREDYDPDKLCNTEFPNRGIWSEQANVEETKNNWLVYKPVNRYDFPKSFGKLTALDGIENRQVIARFENKTLLYNALYTAPTTAGQVYLGKPLFDTTTPPIDYADTDLGYVGSQHKLFLKTEIGHIQTDAKRGQIFLIQGQKATDIAAEGLSKFLSEYLPFEILKTFPDYPIDNHFKGIGLTGTYDPMYERFILTKLDYKPLKPLIYKDGKLGILKTKTVTTYPPICPPGFKYVDGECVKGGTVPATKISDVPFVAQAAPYAQYGLWGTALYSTYNSNGTGVYTMLPDIPLWSNPSMDITVGPLNRTGIWNSISGDPLGTWVGVTKIVINDTDTPKTYYVGLGADNLARFSLNCDVQMTMDPNAMAGNHAGDYIGVTFRKWHIYPVVLAPGVNYLTIENKNNESVGILGCEVYDNTPEEIAAATTLDDLNIIFSTADLVGKTVESFNYTCGDGDCSNTIIEIDGNYYCSGIIKESPNLTPTVKTTTEFEEIPFTNTEYFCNNSFTLSFNFKTRSWTSFHSYFPNFYAGNSNFFFVGKNDGVSSLWRHNTSKTGFNNFFNELSPYTIEYPLYFKGTDEILQSVKDYSKILKYSNFSDFIETDDVYFSEAMVYNNQQHSGKLILTKKPKNSISSYSSYPKYNPDSKEILYTKSNSFYQFNTFWALQKSSQQPMWKKSCESLSIYKEINNDNMNYSKRSFNKAPLMSKDARIRLTNNTTDVHKFITQFIITETQTSFK